MSPRTTQRLHEIGHLARFLEVVLVLHESSDLCCQPATPALALGRLSDRLSSGFGAAEASPAGDFVQRTQPVTSEPERERVRGRWHDASVARNALRSYDEDELPMVLDTHEL